MVASISSLTGNGLRDWVTQRLSAFLVAVYAIMLLGFFMTHSPLSYGEWHKFFQCSVVRVFSLIFIFSLVLHAWIGVWTVTTDYLKCTVLRIIVQLGFALMLVICLAWGIDIFWGM